MNSFGLQTDDKSRPNNGVLSPQFSVIKKWDAVTCCQSSARHPLSTQPQNTPSLVTPALIGGPGECWAAAIGPGYL